MRLPVRRRVVRALLRSIPRRRSGGADIVAVVALGARNAVERGAQDYLVKRRVDPEVLGRSVRYAIERKRAEGELDGVPRADQGFPLLRQRLQRTSEIAEFLAVLARLLPRRLTLSMVGNSKRRRFEAT